MKKRLFSGIQPTGSIHIGNYLGAIQRWVELAQSGEYESIFSVVDYHAMTIPYPVQEMKNRILEAATLIMAAGITPENASLFVQSHVPEHTELAWILNCNSTMGELNRMTQYKDKSKDKTESVSVGLFTYPVLMIADILIYKAQYVPVGEDQLQHLELTRECVRRFNKTYGDIFPEPQPILGQAKRVLGLDGVNKMSKSLGNTIGVIESPEVIWKKLAGAKTDERRQRKQDPGDPKDCNVYNSYHQYFTPKEQLDQITNDCKNATIGCVQCKRMLAKNMESMLGPIREKYQALINDPKPVYDFLKTSAEKCRKIAQETMDEVHEKLGIKF